MALSTFLWLVTVAIGPVVLACAFVYAQLRRRRLSRSEQIDRDRATDRLYDKDSGDAGSPAFEHASDGPARQD